MSVYTPVGQAELAPWLASLAVGELRRHAGIAAGMQNSNYYVDTAQGRWVLTLFESVTPAALDFYLPLLAHYAAHGLPCARPVPDAEGRYWRPLAGKPAALVTCLAGKDIENPTAEHCAALGRTLAQLHAAGRDFPAPQPNPCGLAWCQAVGATLLPLLPEAEAALLRSELAWQARQERSTLPRGIVHGDLFRDNVLWSPAGTLSGLLDFYFAGEDCLMYDLAVTANDWCATPEALAALRAGYRAVRPTTPAEDAAWPGLRRLAALRFWLLRLEARHLPRPGEMVTRKDPAEFRHLLERLRLAENGSAG